MSVFERVDLQLLMPDNTSSPAVVMYHDNMLHEILREAVEDAKKVGGKIIVLNVYRTEK